MNPAVESGAEIGSAGKHASTLPPERNSRQPGSPSEPLLNLILCRLNGIDRRLDELEARSPGSNQNGNNNTIVLDKEHDRVLKEMDTIAGTYAGHQTWSPKDRERFKALKARRDELRKMLGITV